MTERARTGHSVFHPDDVYLVRAPDDGAIHQEDAGNGKPLRASIRWELEFYDVDLTDDDPEPSDNDPKESLADRCRRWVREDRELRSKRLSESSYLSQIETFQTEGVAA